MRGKKEADLLQKTYHDRLTVVRKRLGRDPHRTLLRPRLSVAVCTM